MSCPEPDPDNPHGYFEWLKERDDCAFAYSLRDDASLSLWRGLQYDPIADAAKITVYEGQSGAPGCSVTIGPSGLVNVVFVYDFQYGPEWRYTSTWLPTHKEAPVSLRFGDKYSFGRRMNFKLGCDSIHTQPPAQVDAETQQYGPYIGFLVPHTEDEPLLGPGTTEGGAKFPPEATSEKDWRWYNNEGIQPMHAECGVVPDRWHRCWDILERAPELDWISQAPGATFLNQPMTAYRWWMFGADEARDPIMILDGAHVTIGHPATHTGGIGKARFSMSAGNAGDKSASMVGRGDLITHQRNYVCLHGTSVSEAFDLLQRPVGGYR